MNKNASRRGGRAVGTVALMMGATVIAKLLGMLRGVLQASAYGTSWEANAITAATRLPLTAFDLILSAAILGCFIPVYNSFKENDVDRAASDEADRFACVFVNFIILVCGVLAVFGIVFAEPLVGLITNGLDAATVDLAVTLTRVMFPLVIFSGAAYTLVGVLQSKGSFIAPALISAVSNLGVVLYLLLLDAPLGDRSVYGLAVAYLVSWVLQLLTLVIPLWRQGFKYRLLLDFKNPALKKALKMAPPIMVGSWLLPTGTLLGQYFAARVAAVSAIGGATTVFDYASNLYLIIAGILTYSICNYTFPKISRLSASGDTESFYATVRGGLISSLFIIVPFMAAALVLSGEGVAIVYMRGEFGADDAYNTARALRFILPAMPFFCVIELFSRTFYAKGQPRVPMYAALVGILANLTAGAVLTPLGVLDIGAVGLANAIGQAAAAVVLIIFAVARFKGLFNKNTVFKIIKIAIGGIIVFSICAVLSHLISDDPYDASLVTNVWKAAAIFVPSATVYLIYARLVRIKFD